ncbi:antitoxin [Scrofimicrobium canadense]|nr:antitoxin [Scrofimicrobium canadense]
MGECKARIAYSDGFLDKASEAAKKVTGGRFDEHIDSARDAADKKLGTE